MRNMDYIGISQSIGRVIRLGGSEKTFGLVCIPTYDSVGISTARKVQAVVDVVFNQGQHFISQNLTAISAQSDSHGRQLVKVSKRDVVTKSH